MFTSTLLLQLALMALTILVYLIAGHLFLRYKCHLSGINGRFLP
jgi:hypothetical protein